MSKRKRDESETLESAPDVSPEEDSPVESSIPEIAPVPESLPEAPNLPEPKQALIPLRAYVAVSGKRFDQIAGFLSYAKSKRLGPLTMEDWIKALEQFNTRPV